MTHIETYCSLTMRTRRREDDGGMLRMRDEDEWEVGEE
jgi:hypothetical protein